MRSFFQILLLSSALTLTGCSDNTQIFSSTTSGATKQSSAASAGYYKVGNPYQVAGVWYYPKEDYTYKEIGVSSWYGPDFHNGITANGELYDMHALTAAHRTLPLPSVVRVTNLQNGRSLVLRVNDRGPFVNNRVIDVSMRAAQMLGFKEQGTTQVQVEILPEESKKLKEELLAKAEGATVAAPTALNETEYRQEQVDRPRDLDYSPNRPRLANPPPAVESAPLVAASAQKTTTPYNDWDEDLPKAQAQRTFYEEPAAKQKAAPKPQPKPQPKPAPSKKSVPSAVTAAVAPGYYVQVGAFGSAENAEKMKNKVSRFGSATIQPTTANGKTLYRVRLGPADAKKALEMMDKLSNNGIADARLVEEKGNMTAGKRLDSAF
ncbi:MAG: septal ring lytic transglycosylase RlpA family protein [Alphaproteobacteria bacterium]|nr:septal ring lytic transglycosylase RlpA family protein [Alphaproteobacteria bacterium]